MLFRSTFVRAFKNIKRFHLTKRFQPWLYQIATNFCTDHIRKHARVVSLKTDIENSDENTLETIVREEEHEEVRKAVFELPNIYRQPILGYYFGNYTYKALSTNLAIPINTLRTRLRRGRGLIAKSIK